MINDTYTCLKVNISLYTNNSCDWCHYSRRGCPEVVYLCWQHALQLWWLGIWISAWLVWTAFNVPVYHIGGHSFFWAHVQAAGDNLTCWQKLCHLDKWNMETGEAGVSHVLWCVQQSMLMWSDVLYNASWTVRQYYIRMMPCLLTMHTK